MSDSATSGCGTCGAALPTRRKFCSLSCFGKFPHANRHRPPPTRFIEATCSVCQTTFTVAAVKHRRSTCSRACMLKAQADGSRATQTRKVWRTCEYCGESKLVSPCYATRRFCSTKCAARVMRGPDSPTWRGGVLTYQQSLYTSAQWAAAAASIKARDNDTCRRCSAPGTAFRRDMPVHHIAPIETTWSRRLDEANLVLLCTPCHRFVHSKANTSGEFIDRSAPRGEDIANAEMIARRHALVTAEKSALLPPENCSDCGRRLSGTPDAVSKRRRTSNQRCGGCSRKYRAGLTPSNNREAA